MNHPSEVYADDGRSRRRRPDRGGAYRDAQRHTRRVRILRWVIPIGCVAGLGGLLAVMIFDPFGKVPQNLSIGAMGLSGTKVTMELPKLSGYRDNGRRYDVRAASGVQDIKVPNVIELVQMEASFDTNDQTRVRIVSPSAVYDSARDAMQLRGDVRITSDSGYDIRMRDADVDMKAGTIHSAQPVTVTMPHGTVSADGLEAAGGGEQITFAGNVKTLLVPPAGKGDDAEVPKGER